MKISEPLISQRMLEVEIQEMKYSDVSSLKYIRGHCYLIFSKILFKIILCMS